MASADSWLSPDVMHALGWALIHSLWQGVAVAALAASLMALSRRPALRYFVAVGALAVMLAAPVATFFVLVKPPVAVQAVTFSASVSAMPAPATAPLTAIVALETLPHSAPNLLSWLVGAWLCGVALFSLRIAGGFLLLEHRRRKLSVVPGAAVLAIGRDLQRRLGLNRAIRYLECGWLEAPAVIGWFRPIVLLSALALTGLSEDQLRAVIAHELAHVRRLDAFVNLFQIWVETLLFYHPAMWWLNRRIRAERELCCDEIAVSLTGDRMDYARALTAMAAWKAAPALAMAANRGPLTARILHILGRGPSRAGQRLFGLTGGVLFLAAALAAAQALFGIAYPTPMAHARESIGAALSSGQAAVDHVVRQALQEPVQDLAPPPADLSRLKAARPLATPVIMASNAPARSVSQDTQASMPDPAERLVAPVIPEPSIGPIQAALNDPAPTPPNAGSDATSSTFSCRNHNATGRVIAPEGIQMPGFQCDLTNLGNGDDATFPIRLGHFGEYFGRPNKQADITMRVKLADAADAGKMQAGGRVTVSGDIRVTKFRDGRYFLAMTDAKVVWVDPFDRTAAPVPSGTGFIVCDPPELVALSKQVGRRLCAQNDIVNNLGATGPTLAEAASSLVRYPEANASADDPNAITCRQPKNQTSSRVLPPVTCAHNSYWNLVALRSKKLNEPNIPPFYANSIPTQQ